MANNVSDDFEFVESDLTKNAFSATKFASAKNTSYKTSFESRPDLGPRKESEFADYSWNEVTMSQSLRRMQVSDTHSLRQRF